MAIRPVIANNKELTLERQLSYLGASASSGDGTITVYSIQNFAIDKVLLIGDFGNEGSEIIKTHASTAPTGKTVTLASNLTKDHPKDTPVYIIPYDQIEISWSATSDGSKDVLSTTSIDAEKEDTIYDDTTKTSGYYFVRYKNSIDSSVSTYSDPIPYAGLSSNTVGYAITMAMQELKTDFDDQLTPDFLFRKLNAMLRYVRGKLKKWNNFQEFDYILGQTARGSISVAMPSDAYDQNSNKAILSVRIGTGEPLNYMDKKEYDEAMEDQKHTQIATQPSIGDTSLVLDSTADLASSGTLSVYYDNTKYSITYTAKDDDTATISGIPASGDGSITVAFPVDTNCWQSQGEGTPSFFTVYGGYIHFDTLVSSTSQGKNIYMDYYTDITEIDSEGDVLVGPRFDMAVYYLKAWIRAIKDNNGKLEENDPDYLLFLEILSDAKRQEHSGQKFKMKPKLNSISYPSSGGRFDYE